MSAPRTVPLLPCAFLDDAVDFAAALGLEVTFRQGPPHPYAALRSDDGIELHYFEVLGFDPVTSHGSCLVIVADPVAVLERWSGGLDERYGTVPVRGIPRLMRPTARTSTEDFLGFSVVDVGGNRIRVVREAEAVADDLLVAETIVVDPVIVEPEPEPAAEPEPDPEDGDDCCRTDVGEPSLGFAGVCGG